MACSKDINHLPDEILVEIFSYLAIEDLVLNIKNVSIRWEEVVRNCSLWKHLKYRPGYRYTEREIIGFLRQAPNLRRFLPQFRYSSGKLLNAVIRNCKDIRELEVCIDKSDYSLVEKLVTKCQNIEALTVLDRDFSNTKSLKIISKCLKLKILRLIGHVSMRSLSIFSEVAFGYPALEELDIRHLAYFNNSDLERLLNLKSETIVSLYLYCCDEGQACCLPVVFKSCPMLKLLHINGHGCAPELEDFESFKNMRNLHDLTMSDFSCYSVTYVRNFFEHGNVENLVKIDLSSFDTVESLARAICEKCINLKSLNLGDCEDLTDECLEPIWNLTNLEYLNIHRSEYITDEGVSYVIKCTKLKYFNLNECYNVTNISLVFCCMYLKMLRELHINACRLNPNSLLTIPYELKYLKSLSINMKGLNGRTLRFLKELMPNLNIHLENIWYASSSSESEEETCHNCFSHCSVKFY